MKQPCCVLCCITVLESRIMNYTFLCSVADKLLDTVRVKVRTVTYSIRCKQTPYYRIDLPIRFCNVFIFLQ